MRLKVYMLGSFQMTWNDQSLNDFRSDKARGLLAYLAVQAGRPQRRSQLATLFWGEYPEQAARRSLTSALANLRQLIPTLNTPAGPIEVLTASRQAIQFNLVKPYVWSDVGEFDELLAICESHAHRSLAHCPACIDRLARAAGFYRGDLLADLTLKDSSGFDEWRSIQAEARQYQAQEALHILTSHHITNRDFGTAERYARQQIALMPWRETAHRQLMLILASQGQRNAALAAFEACHRVLAEELSVEPDQGTLDLYNKIRSGQTQFPTAVPLAPMENPYKGLRAFQEADAVDFFGREATVEALFDVVQRRSLMAVIGPSGSGKSSVVLAGLLPRLRSQSRSIKPVRINEDAGEEQISPRSIRQNTWQIAQMRPGKQPFHALAAALLQIRHPRFRPGGDAPDEEIQRLAQSLAHAETGLIELVNSLIPAGRSGPSQRLLLVVDSFEELYTLCSGETRYAFPDILLGGLSQATWPPPITILITLRADYMSTALSYRLLADALQESTFVLGPMTQEELERAILYPAQAQEILFQEGLINRILEDVGSAPGKLPLLEFCLTQLWEQQTDGWLTHSAYQAIGRVEGAVTRYADQVYAELSPDEQHTARRIFTQLVRPGPDIEDNRRPASRAELGEDVWPLVQKLADARLVVTDRDSVGHETVEIIHEALIRDWDRLRSWMAADRAFRTWQHRLRNALNQWEESGYDPGALLRGVPLAEAEQWAASRSNDLSQAERRYVAASQAQRDADMAAAEAGRRRELEQARALAQAEHERAEIEARSSRRLRWLALGLTLVFAIAIITAFMAVAQSREASRQAKIAEAERIVAEEQATLALARQLSAQAVAAQDSAPDLALLLGVKAASLANAPELRRDLMLGLRIDPLLDTFLHGQAGSVQSFALSPDGTLAASGEIDGQIVLWDLNAKRPLTTTLRGHSNEVDSLVFSPDGRFLASNDALGAIILWDMQDLKQSGRILSGHGDLAAMHFSGDARTLLSVSADGTARTWDVASGQPLGNIIRLVGNEPEGMAISPDGALLAVKDGVTVTIHSALNGLVVGRPLLGHSASISHVTFSPDGAKLATSSWDQTIRLWDVATGELLYPPLSAHSGRVLVSAFSPDGRLLASGGTDKTIYIWNAETGQLLGAPLLGHGGWVRTLAFSPDAKYLLSGSSDGKIIRWNLQAHRSLAAQTKEIRGVAFSPDGKTLASGSFDTTVVLWDVASGRPLHPPLAGHSNAVLNVAFNPRGDMLASGSAGGEIILWDVAPARQLGPTLSDHDGPVVGLVFSPDGSLLAAGNSDGTITLWDVASGQPARPRLTGHESWVISLAFSPDGKMLASGSWDSNVRLWDVATGEAIGQPLAEHTNWVTSLAFSPDGKILASGSEDTQILLWDVESQTPLGLPLTGHTSHVWYVEFREEAGGLRLISGDGDGSVLLWDLNSGELVGPRLSSNLETESMAVSPAGDLVALGAFDASGAVHLWQLDLSPWPERACRIANRNLSQEEWQRYMGDLPYHKTCP